MNFFSSNTPFWRPLSLMILLLLGNTVYANEIPNFNLNDPMLLSDLSSLHWADDSLTATPSLAKAKAKMLTGELITGLFRAHHWFAFTLSNPLTVRSLQVSLLGRRIPIKIIYIINNKVNGSAYISAPMSLSNNVQ
jgi:hypothetical protein